MNPRAKVINIPNLITGGRFVLAGCLTLLLMQEQTTAMALAAFSVFFLAAVSDWIDGYYARRYHSITVLGKLMDPLADKILITVALIMLIPLDRVPAWVALLILCREMVVTGLRGLASSSGIVVAASQLGKWKSTFQYIALGTLLFPLGVLPIPHLHEIGTGILYLALALTLWSGGDYIYKLRRIFMEDV